MKKWFLFSAIVLGFALMTALSCNRQGERTGQQGAVPAENITLTLIDSQAYAVDRGDEVIRNFAEANGITIDAQHYANNLEELLLARVNSGQTPDVFTSPMGASLEAYSEYGIDWAGDPVLGLFQEEMLRGCIKDGKVYALPWDGEAYSLIYNKKVFQTAGITELPTTLNGLEAVCQKLEAAGVTPFAIGHMSSWVLGHIAGSFFTAENPDVQVTINALSSGEKTFEDLTYFKNVFDLIDMTLKYGPAKPMEIDWERSEAMLANGEAGIIHMGTWAEAMFHDLNPDIDMAFIPTPVSNDGYEPKVAVDTAWGYIVHKDGKHVDMAKKLVEYILTSDDGVDWISQALGVIPPLKKQPASINGQLSNDASKYIARGLSLPWAYNYYPAGMTDFVGNTLQAYAAGDVTREEAMRMLTNEWKLSL
jgi:raffinose/stachyose/melibiose transport system substrate-binding protein